MLEARQFDPLRRQERQNNEFHELLPTPLGDFRISVENAGCSIIDSKGNKRSGLYDRVTAYITKRDPQVVDKDPKTSVKNAETPKLNVLIGTIGEKSYILNLPTDRNSQFAPADVEHWFHTIEFNEKIGFFETRRGDVVRYYDNNYTGYMLEDNTTGFDDEDLQRRLHSESTLSDWIDDFGWVELIGRERLRNYLREQADTGRYEGLEKEEYERVRAHLLPDRKFDDGQAIDLAIGKADHPVLKADLVRGYVYTQIEAGKLDDAVVMLGDVNSVELPGMGNFDDAFVTQLYLESVKKKKVKSAWRIANTMVFQRDRIVPTQQVIEMQSKRGSRGQEEEYVPVILHPHAFSEDVFGKQEQWHMRESEIFAEYAQSVLDWNRDFAKDQSGDIELEFIFNQMCRRSDNGFNTTDISDLTKRVAAQLIKQKLKHKDIGFVFDYAERAQMDNEYMRQLRRDVSTVYNPPYDQE